MRLVIDSSVFVSSLGIDDEFTKTSRLFFRKIINEQVFVPSLVVAETLTIVGKQKKKSVASLLRYFYSLILIPLNQEFLNYFAKHLPTTTSLKTNDFIIAITAKMHKALLITWDSKLLSSAGKICQVLTPGDYLKQE